jgi:Arc/MetJ family transcription regulator
MSRALVLGSLVDVRNIDAHKAVRLTIEVPAELAPQVMAVFGWPTRRAPVPVAIARMAGEQKGDERSLAQQAGALCTNAVFQAYLDAATEEECAEVVRNICEVKSRSEIRAGTKPGDLWLDLVERFHGWQAAEQAGA